MDMQRPSARTDSTPTEPRTAPTKVSTSCFRVELEPAVDDIRADVEMNTEVGIDDVDVEMVSMIEGTYEVIDQRPYSSSVKKVE